MKMVEGVPALAISSPYDGHQNIRMLLEVIPYFISFNNSLRIGAIF